MIESIFSFTLIFLVVIQGSYLLTSEWKRHRCQVFLFQNLRSQLEQNPSSLLPLTRTISTGRQIISEEVMAFFICSLTII
jgi:hypothetical protein